MKDLRSCWEVGWMIRIAPVLLAILILSLSLDGAQAAQGVAVDVIGEVSNGTPGGPVPEALTVTLHVFSDMEETDVYTTTLTADSGFRFDDVSVQPAQTLIARTAYGGVSYLSDFATVESPEEDVSLSITVYETTSSASDVAVAQLHVFLDRVGEQIQVTEYAVLTNRGERTYVGSGRSEIGEGVTWAAALPTSAQELRFEGGASDRFFVTEAGFADTRPIPPGQGGTEASFSYDLPCSEGLEIEQSFDLPLNAVVLVLPGEELGLEGPGLSSEETLETQMGPAVSYTAGPLAAGEPLSFTIVRRGTRTPEATAVDQSGGLGIGFGALVGAAAVVYFLWMADRAPSIPPEALPQVEAIAALDRDFEAGQLPEKAYRTQRRALKRRLRDLLAD